MPLHCLHEIYLLTFIFFSTPLAMSFNESFTLTLRFDPFIVLCAVRLLPKPLKPPKPPKPPPKISPNWEKMSSTVIPPPEKPLPAPLTPACPKRSYRDFFWSSRSTSYASAASLNFSSALLSPGFLSGWNFRACFL